MNVELLRCVEHVGLITCGKTGCGHKATVLFSWILRRLFLCTALLKRLRFLKGSSKGSKKEMKNERKRMKRNAHHGTWR